MSVPSKSITAASNYSLWLLISISRGTTLVISPFFIPSVLKTSNKKFIGFIWILLSLTSCSLIPVCVHPESTNALTLSFFLFFVFMSACTFNSLFPLLLQQFGIMYLFWKFTWEISCTMPTRDLHQNPALLSCLSHHLIPSESFVSSLTVFPYSPLQCTLPFCI